MNDAGRTDSPTRMRTGRVGGSRVRWQVRVRSLRWRLWAATWALTGLALVLAGTVLASLFREQVMRQFQQQLVVQLDQLTALLQFDAQGRPSVPQTLMYDPRWQRPFSGLYWQVEADERATAGPPLRSRSLWDVRLQGPSDALLPGQIHAHAVSGPAQQSLWLVERVVQVDPEAPTASGTLPARWRLMVAADLAETQAALQDFRRVLLWSLGALWLLLSLAAWVQMRIGLAPLQALQQAVQALRQGQRERLQGQFPSEVQPLVDDFNAVLALQDETAARARASAGNLAHALKTPLTVLAQAAQAAQAVPAQQATATATSAEGAAPAGVLAAVPAVLVREQVQRAQRHLDWHLARARRVPTGRPAVRQTAVAPAVAGLVRVLQRVHAERALTLEVALAPDLQFAGEAEDLQEILGNLLDNACKWARSRVRIGGERQAAAGSASTLTGMTAGAASGSAGQAGLLLWIDDDGPGIDDAALAQVLQRGVRLDESTPGSGLGLSIVDDAVRAHGGQLTLGRSPWGGLRASLRLPSP